MSLQLIFTDGEEAFKHWSSSDSLYGARELAHEMNQPGGLLSVSGKTGIQALEAFVLLDLIGSTDPHPVFHDSFGDTTNLFQKLVKIGMFCALSPPRQGDSIDFLCTVYSWFIKFPLWSFNDTEVLFSRDNYVEYTVTGSTKARGHVTHRSRTVSKIRC